MTNLCSIVIRTWNRATDIKETLEILKQEKYDPLEIIVVDNGSRDNTVSMLKTFFPKVKVVALPENTGVAATNVGVKESRGEYIVILDDDAHPESGVISCGIEHLINDPKIGIIAFKIVDLRTWLSPQARLEKIQNLENISKDGIETKIFQGGGFAIKRDVFELAGGFPEDFFWGGEESDLAFKVLDAGYKIKYFPNLVVVHRASPVNRINKKKVYWEIRNIIWLYWCYSPIFLALLKTAYSIVSLGMKAIQKRAFFFFISGVFDGVKGVPARLRKRRVIYTQTIRFMIKSFVKRVRRSKCLFR